MKFEKGDWVIGRSRDGELIHGFIENIDLVQSIMKVFVVKSDNEIIIGKSVWILNKYTEKLPQVDSTSEDEILALIDLALLTRDEQWFSELTKALKVSKKGTNGTKMAPKVPINRLENFDTIR